MAAGNIKQDLADLHETLRLIQITEKELQSLHDKSVAQTEKIQTALRHSDSLGDRLDDFLFLIYGADFLSQQKAKKMYTKFLEILNSNVGQLILFISESWHEWRKDYESLAKQGLGNWRFEKLHLGKIQRSDTYADSEGIHLSVDFCELTPPEGMRLCVFHNTIRKLFSVNQPCLNNLMGEWCEFLTAIESLEGFDNDDAQYLEDLLLPIRPITKDFHFTIIIGAKAIGNYIDMASQRDSTIPVSMLKMAQKLHHEEEIKSVSQTIESINETIVQKTKQLESQLKALLANLAKSPGFVQLMNAIQGHISDATKLNLDQQPEVKELKAFLETLDLPES